MKRWNPLVVVLLVASCSSPTSPSTTAPAPVVVGPRFALTGVVRAAALPVQGARVALLRGEEIISSVATDASGEYGFSSADNVSFSGALVGVSKHEYFTDTKYILMNQDRSLDFDLEPVVRVQVGDVVQSPVGSARCASLGYGGMGGALCRRLALTVTHASTLEATVSSAGLPFDLTILRPNSTIAAYAASSLSPVRASARVEPGTYQIDVVHVTSAAREFELTTLMR